MIRAKVIFCGNRESLSKLACVQISEPFLALNSLVASRGLTSLNNPISLKILPKRIYRVMGKNGAGKTTLLRIVAGLKSPLQGTVQGEGHCCFIGHQDCQNFDLTVIETLNIWSQFYGGDPQTAIDVFALESLLTRPIYQLSQGQKQRLALARLFCGAFNFWILDEPFSNLDGVWIKKIEQLFLDYTRTGGSIIFSEHAQIARLFDPEPIILENPT